MMGSTTDKLRALLMYIHMIVPVQINPALGICDFKLTKIS